MAVKKTTTKKAATKDTKTTKAVSKKKDFVRILEAYIYVILAIVVAAFIIFAAGMASGAAMIFR